MKQVSKTSVAIEAAFKSEIEWFAFVQLVRFLVGVAWALELTAEDRRPGLNETNRLNSVASRDTPLVDIIYAHCHARTVLLSLLPADDAVASFMGGSSTSTLGAGRGVARSKNVGWTRMASAQSPQQGPGAETLVRESEGAKHP